MKKRNMWLILLVLALVLALSACQSAPEAEVVVPETSEDVETAVSEPTIEPVAEESVEEAVDEAAAEPVTISFWYPYAEGSWTGDFLTEKIGEFNAANPHINVEGQSFTDYGSVVEGLQRSAIAGDLPGVATIAYGGGEYMVNSGLAMPIESYLGEEADAYLADFYPTLLEASTVNGEVYGVPWALSVAEIFYHADLFEQAGLDPDNPPQTWEEFLDAAQQIHDKLGIYGATFAMDDTWTFETAVRSNGGSFVSGDGQLVTLDDETAVATLEDWATGAENGAILYNADFMETLQTFGAQQVAMFGVSSYGTLYYKDNMPTVRAMPWPAAEGHQIQSPAGGNSLFLFGNNDAEREAAAQFIMFLTSPEANAEWAMNSGYLPTRQSSLAIMDEFVTGFENYETAVTSIQNVVPVVQYPGEDDPLIGQALMDAIEAAMLGEKDAATALQEANTSVNSLAEN